MVSWILIHGVHIMIFIYVFKILVLDFGYSFFFEWLWNLISWASGLDWLEEHYCLDHVVCNPIFLGLYHWWFLVVCLIILVHIFWFVDGLKAIPLLTMLILRITLIHALDYLAFMVWFITWVMVWYMVIGSFGPWHCCININH